MRRQLQEEEVKRSLKLKKHQRGQAMFEYTFVSHILMLGGAFTMWVFTGYLFNSLNAFYDSIYFVLQSSVP